MANFDGQKSEWEGPKKRLSPNPYRHVLFVNNRVQIGQVGPLWPHLYFNTHTKHLFSNRID